MTLAKLRARHAEQERALVRAALVRCDWRARRAAVDLNVPPSTLHRIMDRMGLGDEYACRSPGRGRPKGSGGIRRLSRK